MQITSNRQRSRKKPYAFGLLILVLVIAAVVATCIWHNPLALKPSPAIAKPSARVIAVAPAPPKPVNHCESNTVPKFLLISISSQHLWACEGTTQVNESAVTTGMTEIVNGVDNTTPTGTWKIYAKQTNRYLNGSNANGSWHDFVQYWMPFDGPDGVGFHDASWQTFAFGGPEYKTNGSNGCVHLPTDFAGWVYTWAPIGTTVTIEA